ncbi:MAG: hypothetical protein QM761_07830 [Pseudoxanthomonas sp.]
MKKIIKWIAVAIGVGVVLSLVGGYVYFDRKFTPEENRLTVLGEARDIPVKWVESDGNPHAALLLPVKIRGIDRTFFMQLDSGAPSTVFYRNALQSLRAAFPGATAPAGESGRIAMDFGIGDLRVSSAGSQQLNYGSGVDVASPDAVNIIGTVGTDLLEKRVAVLDFKSNVVSFVEKTAESGFSDLEFRKRKILIPATLGNESLKLLYDSGTSGYQLLVNHEKWQELRIANAPARIEKGNSWGRALKVVSAPADRKLQVSGTPLQLSEVTYVEGTSRMQQLLMKRSGMQGMVGNRIFLNHVLVLDAANRKFKVE